MTAATPCAIKVKSLHFERTVARPPLASLPSATGTQVRALVRPGPPGADFVVLFPGISGYPGFTDRQAVLATFGRPGRTYHVGQYTILWWPKNLLADVR